MNQNIIFGNLPSTQKDETSPQGANGRDQGAIASDFGATNRLYFYTPVTPETVLRLNQQISMLTIELQCQALRLNHTPANIYLHISSGGGYIVDALNAVDTIANNPIPITTVVEGFAASAATLMSIAGRKRTIKKNSYMLIHQLSSVTWGTFQQLEDDMENNKALMKKIKDLYKQYSKVPMKELDEVLRHDLYWDSAKCLDMGLVDEIL